MANQVNVKITGDVSGLVEGAKKGQQAIQQLGNESQKSANKIKTIGAAANNEKKIINQLAYQYYQLSDAEKAAFGPRIQQQMNAHIAKLKEFKAVQNNINTQIQGTTTNFAKMGNAFSMAGAQLGLPIGNLTSLLNPTTAAIAAIAALGAAFVATAKKTEAFNVALNDLSVRLNIPQDQLKQFGDDAITVGNKFGVSAEEIVKQFQYMAQQAPGLEKDRDGLLALSDAANTLAIDFGVDVKDATNSVMTVLSKYNLEAAEAANISNVLAEACRNTGADLEYQRQVFEKVGSAANATGISYQELASATGVLSSTFNDANTVGSGLSMMITKLQKAQDDYNPAVVGLTQAIKNMSDANLSYSDIVSMVGPRAAQVTQVLISQQQAFDDLTTKMENTQAAEEMFGVKSEELGFVINKIKTMWENFLIKIGESAVFQTVMGIISDICKWIEQLSEDLQQMFDQSDELSGLAQLWETLREAISDVLPVIGAIIKVFVSFYNKVYAIISDVIKIWLIFVKGLINAAKTLWDNIKAIWNAIYDKIADNAVIRNVVKAYNWMKEKIIAIFKKIAEAWNSVMDSVGMDSLKIKLSADTGGDVGAPPSGGHTTVSNPTTTDVTDTTTSGGGKGNKGGNKGGNNTGKTYDAESVEWYNQKIKEQNDLLKSKKNTEDEERKIIANIVDLEKKRDDISKKQENQKKWQEEVQKILNKEQTTPQLTMSTIDLSKVKVTPPQLSEDRLKEMYENGVAKLNDLQDKYDLGIINEDEFLRRWDLIKTALTEEGLTVEIKPELKQKAWQKGIAKASDALNELGDTFSAVASATGSEELNVMGVIAQSIANIALGTSKAIAESSSLGPWGWIAFSLAAMTQMASMIAQIHSATGYAEGGIVQGSTTMGDKIVTRLNAGEMVLNQRQQTNLFNALDNGLDTNNENNYSVATVKVRGSDLYLALKNYGKTSNKTTFK